jgi:hypothetical protein
VLNPEDLGSVLIDFVNRLEPNGEVIQICPKHIEALLQIVAPIPRFLEWLLGAISNSSRLETVQLGALQNLTSEHVFLELNFCM